MYGLEAYLLGLKLEVLGNSDRTGTSSLTSLSSWAGRGAVPAPYRAVATAVISPSEFAAHRLLEHYFIFDRILLHLFKREKFSFQIILSKNCIRI